MLFQIPFIGIYIHLQKRYNEQASWTNAIKIKPDKRTPGVICDTKDINFITMIYRSIIRNILIGIIDIGIGIIIGVGIDITILTIKLSLILYLRLGFILVLRISLRIRLSPRLRLVYFIILSLIT